MTAELERAREAARTIMEHKANERGWGYTEDVRLVARALLALPAQEAWRTMDSAPKDGTHVLLATNVDPPAWVCEGYYEADGDRGWYQANTHWTDVYEGLVYPTHWRPLPAPPTERE